MRFHIPIHRLPGLYLAAPEGGFTSQIVPSAYDAEVVGLGEENARDTLAVGDDNQYKPADDFQLCTKGEHILIAKNASFAACQAMFRCATSADGHISSGRAINMPSGPSRAATILLILSL